MRRFIRDYLLENWNLKITALLLALIVWLFVRGEPGPERVVLVPLEVLVSHHMEITGDRPSMIEITMRGAAFSGAVFGQTLPTCTIDLQSASEGSHVVPLTLDNIKVPKGLGVEIVRVNPPRVTIVLERTISKRVPVVVPIQGEPAKGYEIYGKSSTPSSIIVTGPRTHIEALNEIATDAIAISEEKQSTRFFLNLTLKDGSIRTSVSQIQVDIHIGPRRKSATVSHVPVLIKDETFVAVPRQLSVQVFAPPDLIRDLTPADFHAEVNVEAMDTTKLPAKAKPQVQLLNSFNEAVIIQNILPPEVLVQRKK
jgi:YbbR domain-containing protein